LGLAPWDTHPRSGTLGVAPSEWHPRSGALSHCGR
jgi:hypothetical protein